MKGSDFTFYYIHLLYFKCCKINQSCDRSYIDSPDWVKKLKVIINSIDKDDH